MMLLDEEQRNELRAQGYCQLLRNNWLSLYAYREYARDHDSQEDVVHGFPIRRDGSSTLVALQFADIIDILSNLVDDLVGMLA